PRLNLFAHEDGENLVGLYGVVELYALERAGLRVHGGFPQLVGIHLAKALEAGDIYFRVRVVPAQLRADAVALGVAVRHTAGLAPRQLIERRDGGVDIAVVYQRAHIAEEEGEQQRPYMA